MRPRSENTFSCAFSRTEQVLNRITSAASGSLVCSSPSHCASTSAILAESYSFIWQPNVLIYTLPVIGVASLALRGGLRGQLRFFGRQNPDLRNLAVDIEP